MRDSFEILMRGLVGTDVHGLSRVDVQGQFRPRERNEEAFLRNINASFLIVLSGKAHPLYDGALDYLETMRYHLWWGQVADFFLEGLRLIRVEVEHQWDSDSGFRESLSGAASCFSMSKGAFSRMETVENLRRVFFPEGVGICQAREEKTRELRKKRTVAITRLNPAPLGNPAQELLFTSNVLLTVPLDPEGIDGLDLSAGLKERVREVFSEEQKYWYDHPVPLGTAPEYNEALYGVRGLDGAVEFEKKRGVVGEEDRVTCVLSVSVTHEGLQSIVREHLEDEFRKGGAVRHLNIYVFTEADVRKLVEDVLIPSVEKYLVKGGAKWLHEVIGVDGEYGRHYTFLKAVSAFWQVLIDPAVRGTFKIDLDQVFPQRELVEQGGLSAFEHYKSPLWGAQGLDSRGREIELGMIAGALVNEKDIPQGIFTPDICFPSEEIKGDNVLFSIPLLQALSTEAEMMTRYDTDELDGRTSCIERIHVTGGTNGILIESLRKYRPFTPGFIGRAEDQAYIMSVLFQGERNLRYVHVPGLIMRHDKDSFAGEAVEAAKVGKAIGDYARMLWFSFYARALPWPVDEIKEAIDPFTGCFVSHIPFTVVYLRLALKAASCFADDKAAEGIGFLEMGARRLRGIIKHLNQEPNPLNGEYKKEKEAWDIYYDVLDRLEEGIENGDGFALEIQKKAREIVEGYRIG